MVASSRYRPRDSGVTQSESRLKDPTSASDEASPLATDRDRDSALHVQLRACCPQRRAVVHSAAKSRPYVVTVMRGTSTPFIIDSCHMQIGYAPRAYRRRLDRPTTANHASREKPYSSQFATQAIMLREPTRLSDVRSASDTTRDGVGPREREARSEKEATRLATIASSASESRLGSRNGAGA